MFGLILLFGWEPCGILALQPGIKPAFPILEGKVLTTELQGKSLDMFLNCTFKQNFFLIEG